MTYLKGVKGRGRENRDEYIVTDRVGGNAQLQSKVLTIYYNIL